MPSLRIWCAVLLCGFTSIGWAAQSKQPAPNPVKAPVQPSAALLEFIGDWNEDERQLIGMDKKADKQLEKQSRRGAPRAP